MKDEGSAISANDKNSPKKAKERSQNTSVSSFKKSEDEENMVANADGQKSEANKRDKSVNSVESPRHLEPLNYVCLKQTMNDQHQLLSNVICK